MKYNQTGRQVRLVATARQMYDGRSLFAGDEFTVSESEADDLIAMNFARRARVAPAITQAFDDRSARPGSPPVSRRTYRRRDMKAE